MERDELVVKIWFEKYHGGQNWFWNKGKKNEQPFTQQDYVSEARKDADRILAGLGQLPQIDGYTMVRTDGLKRLEQEAKRFERFFDVVNDKHPRLAWKWREEASC